MLDMVAIVTCVLFLLLQAVDPFTSAREQMVKEQIEARGIRDVNVLRAMRTTPRDMFVPVELRPQAYEDHPLPIGYNATISQPFIVAWMTELLQPAQTHRVLEIGTGSGYQAAVLSHLVKSVYTIEIVPELARSAEKRLSDLGYKNVTVRAGDGYKGWAENAPFDRIILTAAPDKIPEPLLAQLAPGGRLVAPLGGSLPQRLTVMDKTRTGSLQVHTVGEVLFVPMLGPH